jgi:protein-S-isoprenylcysteine O-methyltransferase Ste14
VNAFLAVRALLAVVLLPGVLVWYVPYEILLASNKLHLPPISASAVAAGLLALAGTLIHLVCIWDFFATGKGTLAPVDPPRHLVVVGLYRYTRNPMYNCVVAVLLGQAWFFGSVPVLAYAAFLLVSFHLVVVAFEEPALEAQFGESYRAYRGSVPRWGFAFRPYDERAG